VAKYKHGVTNTKEEEAEMKTLETLSCIYTEKTYYTKQHTKRPQSEVLDTQSRVINK
jgi:hypothetical protein